MPPNSTAAVAVPTQIRPGATHRPSEDLARLRKATLYADIIEAGEISLEAVEGFTEGQWTALALIAGGKAPSLETRALIRDLIRQRKTWRGRLASSSASEEGGSDAA